MKNLSRQERRAIHEARVEAKRARVTNPTSYDMLHRKAAIARAMSFQNLNFAISQTQTMIHCAVDEAEALELKTLARSACQKSRRNAETARFVGCALHRI